MKKNTKLKQILKDKGITQTYVASKVNMSIKSFNDLVNGKVAAKVEIMSKVADVLKVNMSDLI